MYCLSLHLILVATTLCFFGVLTGACWFPFDHRPRPAHFRRSPESHRGCMPHISKAQADAYVAGIQNHNGYSACSPHPWLKQLMMDRNNSYRRATILDVGCNKGYFSAGVLNYLAPGFGTHNALLHAVHAVNYPQQEVCGVCQDCKESATEVLATLNVTPTESVDVWCVEPSTFHRTAVTKARDATYGDPISAPVTKAGTTVRWHMVNTAVSNYTGTASFPVDCPNESCSLAETNNVVPVNVTTVDAFTSERGLPYLDVLKIDTEGFDPAVLAGAYRTLKQHRAQLLVFEYNEWRTGTSLLQCLEYLDELHYECYMDAPRLYKMTGCWDPRYADKKWTNVFCVARGGTLEAEIHATWRASQAAASSHDLAGQRLRRRQH